MSTDADDKEVWEVLAEISELFQKSDLSRSEKAAVIEELVRSYDDPYLLAILQQDDDEQTDFP